MSSGLMAVLVGGLLIILPTLLALWLASEVGGIAYGLLLPWTVPRALLILRAARHRAPDPN